MLTITTFLKRVCQTQKEGRSGGGGERNNESYRQRERGERMREAFELDLRFLKNSPLMMLYVFSLVCRAREKKEKHLSGEKLGFSGME